MQRQIRINMFSVRDVLQQAHKWSWMPFKYRTKSERTLRHKITCKILTETVFSHFAETATENDGMSTSNQYVYQIKFKINVNIALHCALTIITKCTGFDGNRSCVFIHYLHSFPCIARYFRVYFLLHYSNSKLFDKTFYLNIFFGSSCMPIVSPSAISNQWIFNALVNCFK